MQSCHSTIILIPTHFVYNIMAAITIAFHVLYRIHMQSEYTCSLLADTVWCTFGMLMFNVHAGEGLS